MKNSLIAVMVFGVWGQKVRRTHTHTHTHTYVSMFIYIYIYIYLQPCGYISMY